MKNKVYITTPIYYVNAKPHIGHAYTTVAADVLARFFRSQKIKTWFLTGTDEHGEKNAESATKMGKKPGEYVNEISQEFRKTWEKLNISNDDFIQTTEKRHYQFVSLMLTKLKDKGFVYEGEYSGLYCVGCEKFLTEKELNDGLCPDHKKPPKEVAEKNWFFKLSEFLPELEKRIKLGEIQIFPEARYKEVLGLLKQGLTDFSISREKVKWGIPLPWDKNQTVYVWGDALLNYATSVYQGDGKSIQPGDFKFWPPDYQFMAKDIIKFHALYWPAMLMALGLPLPKRIISHGYFTINGDKMSKSVGNVISPEELVEKFGVDATRYLLLSQFPFGNDGDFAMKKVEETYTADLVNGLGNLVRRVQNLVPENLWIEESALDADYTKFMENVAFDKALGLLRLKIAKTDKLIESTKLWELKKDDSQNLKYQEICQELVSELSQVVVMTKPIMPEISQKIINRSSEILFPRLG